MVEKQIRGRLIQKHDTEINWNKAVNFIPMLGEFIVYDRDETHDYERFKIGDGITTVALLPFADDAVCNKLSKYTDFKGEVTSLPINPEEGSMYRLLSDNISTNVDMIDTNSTFEFKTNSVNSIRADDEVISYFIDLVGLNGSGSYDVTTTKYVSFVTSTNDIFTFKVHAIESGYNVPSDWDGSTDPSEYGNLYTLKGEYEVVSNLGSYTVVKYYISDEPITITKRTSNSVVIYKNGKWNVVLEIPDDLASKEYVDDELTDIRKLSIENIKDGETEGSVRTSSAKPVEGKHSIAFGSGATSLGDYSLAFGRDIVAGCKAFFIKSIDFENKKIYLTTTQVIPTADTTDNTDTSFETPAYEVGESFTIKNDNNYNYCGTIASVSNNVITYSDESLGFTGILTANGLSDADNYSFRVPTKPNIGSFVVTGHSYAEGRSNFATGGYSHAEGYGTISDGNFSHTEGRETKASYAAHAEGRGTTAKGTYSHAEGQNTQANSVASHAEGQSVVVNGLASHGEGANNTTHAMYSHIEGYDNTTERTATYSHNEGKSNVVSGECAHAEGQSNTASGLSAHVEGTSCKATGGNAHAEGTATTSSGEAAHAEGNATTASGNGAHAEGQGTVASASQAHAEGYKSQATYQAAHAEGYCTQATKIGAHAEGSSTEATGDGAHAEGYDTTASGPYAHAEGSGTVAKSFVTHAEGQGTIARGNAQHVQGKYNIEDTSGKYAHIQGNGTSSARSNAHTVDWSGNAWFAGNVIVGGTSQTDGATLAKSDLSNIDSSALTQKVTESGFATTGYVDGKILSDDMPIRRFTTSGTSTAYTATIDNYTAYNIGDIFEMIPHATSGSTSPTLNINSLGAKTIRRLSTTVGTTVALRSASELTADHPILLVYNGTYFVMLNNKQPYGGTDFYTSVAVSKGGTGKTSWTANGVVYASGSTSLSQVAQPSEPSVLSQDSSGAPTWTPKSSFAPMYTYGTSDLTPGTSELANGVLYFVYE